MAGRAATAMQWAGAVCVLETSAAPELWTPDRKPKRAVFVHLESMCQRCPVRARCASNAVATEAEAGVYAGVWVLERNKKAPWAEAMTRLGHIAGVEGGQGVDDEALGVPA